jgi:ribonuclease G
VLSEETVALEAERWLRELAAERPEPEAFLVQLNPRVASILVGGHGRPSVVAELERETGKYFHFGGTEALPIDHFSVSLEGSRSEVEERALPFREGEEVHVTIEEPHMYNDDDAVAKLDGYVISVAGAAPLVGEKRMVRIEKVGRSAASASLVGGPPPSSEQGGGNGEGERSRRRGRRGGRRRRKAPAGEGA